MPDAPRIYRPPAVEHEAEVNRSRELVKLSMDVLRQNPEPDTFLGRKTHELPTEEQSEE